MSTQATRLARELLRGVGDDYLLSNCTEPRDSLVLVVSPTAKHADQVEFCKELVGPITTELKKLGAQDGTFAITYAAQGDEYDGTPTVSFHLYNMAGAKAKGLMQ